MNPVIKKLFNPKTSLGGIVIYLLILLASHMTRAVLAQKTTLPPEKHLAKVYEVDRDKILGRQIRMAYQELIPPGQKNAPAVVLLHGSPPYYKTFIKLGPLLAQHYRVIIPDLPGFKDSEKKIKDYSIRAHARYLDQLLQELGIEKAHILGYSMGGGVALNLYDIYSPRVASIIMLSSIGVQEREFLGDYYLNRVFHSMQLAGLWLVQEAIPHFGYFDDVVLDVPYARNFYDSDQRPIRKILTNYTKPLFIIHSLDDRLVPVAAANEHHRLVPQSEKYIYEGNHFIVLRQTRDIVARVNQFINRVEEGSAPWFEHATPERRVLAGQPGEESPYVRVEGIQLYLLLFIIVLGTFITEDITCIATALLIARGSLGWGEGIAACFLGIYLGDLLLFAGGRMIGESVLKTKPLKWFIRPDDVEQCEEWFQRRGPMVIFLSRFIPGTRLPTFLAAGILKTSAGTFALYFFLAVCVWVPLIMGGTVFLGKEMLRYVDIFKHYALAGFLSVGLIVFMTIKVIIPLMTFRGRRSALGLLKRVRHWEFWSPWIFYIPVIFYVLCLAFRHRSLTLFTAANPGILAGGFIGESKYAILKNLSAFGNDVARTLFIEKNLPGSGKVKCVEEFMTANNLRFPIILKPDVGQRGSGVLILNNREELEKSFNDVREDMIAQEYIEGDEFGVFYYRYPGEPRGRIFSITEKKLPVVTGDGKSTLEQLILKDPRAVCMARAYFSRHPHELWDVPARGESVKLINIGTHCRGAVFYDGSWIKTRAIEEKFDEISKRFTGFFFGRYDIRTPNIKDFQEGHNFKILELNGATSEATHIYDPQNTLIEAYKVLFEQWRILFKIAAINKDRGTKVTSITQLTILLLNYQSKAITRR